MATATPCALPVLTLTAALTMTGIQTRRAPRILITALLACAVAANLYLWVGYLLEAYPRGGDVGLARTWLWPGYKPSPTQTIAAGGSLQDVGDGEFEQYVLKSDKPVLQIFWEQTDEQCRAQMPIAENIARRYESVLRVVRTPAENRPIIMQTYQVTALPALLVFRSGNVVFRHTGLMDEAQLSAELDRLLEDPN